MKFPFYMNQIVRYQSFLLHQHIIEPKLLSTSGFFCLRSQDMVQCFSCGIILDMWNVEDIPDVEHLRYSPNCEYVRGKIYSGEISNYDCIISVMKSLYDVSAKLDVALHAKEKKNHNIFDID